MKIIQYSINEKNINIQEIYKNYSINISNIFLEKTWIFIKLNWKKIFLYDIDYCLKNNLLLIEESII